MKPLFSLSLTLLLLLYLAPELPPAKAPAAVPAATADAAGNSYLASLSGNISRASGSPVPGVEVNLSGGSTAQQLTDGNGDYAFTGLEEGSSYTLTPHWPGSCDRACLNIYDLHLMRKHILGIEPINSAYALIAADVNNSGGISTQDYVSLLFLMLGNTDQFPNNNCWRFIPSDHVFSDPSDPFSASFPETETVNSLAGDQQYDFIGVQVGDISDCEETLGNSNLSLILDADAAYCPGEQALIQVRVQDFADIKGLQFTLQWDPALFEFASILNFGLPGLSANNFGQPGNSGQLTMAWTEANDVGQTLGDGSLLFNLYLNPIATVSTTTSIAFTETPLPPLALDEAGLPVSFNTQEASLALESPELAIGPTYCYNGQQFVSFYAGGNVSGGDGSSVFQDRGNGGWMVYELTDNDFFFVRSFFSTPPFCGTSYEAQVGTCAEALLPDCEQPQQLGADVEPDGSLQVQGNKVVWVSSQDGDRDIYAYDLATGITTNISNNTADDHQPHLHGERIAWRSNESGSYEIWAYDCETQLKQQLSQNGTDVDQSPAVFGNYAVWRSDQDGDNDIYLYNLISGTETNLSDDNATGAGSPAIYEDWVLWESTDQGPDVDIFLYSISTQAVQNLSDSPEDEEGLVLQGGLAAWAAFDPNTFAYDLYAYQLSSGTLIPVASDVPLSPNSLAVDEGYVVWADNSDGDNEVYAYRLSDGTTLQLSDNADEDNRPAIHAGQVAWEAFESGAQEIRYYNLLSGRAAILGPDPATDSSPDTYGPFTVWQADRDNNGQQEVYFFNTQLLPPPEAALDAEASTISGLCPGETATLVLEPAAVGLEAVWFDDEQMSNELYASPDNLFQPTVSGLEDFYGAWRDPLTGCLAPLSPVEVDASPTDDISCVNEFSVELFISCQLTLDENFLLGSLGCLQADDLLFSVQDGNPDNGPIIDGAGTFPYTVTLAPDVTGNFTGCSGTLQTLDEEPPVLTCPADITVQAPPGATEAQVETELPTWGDNCAVDESTLMGTTDHNPGLPFPLGQTPVGFSIMDVNGNIGECSYIVEVLPASSDFTITAGSAMVAPGEMFCLPFTVQGFNDILGLQFSIAFDPASLQFNSANDLSPPGMSSFNATGAASGQLSYQWFNEDLSGQTLADGSVLFELCFTALAPGTTSITFDNTPAIIEVVNASEEVLPFSGNPGTVIISTPSVLECPDNIVQDSDPGQCEALIDIPVPAAPGPGTLNNDYTGTADASGAYPVGITTVTYTFFRPADTLSCSFTVTIRDEELPMMECPPLMMVTGTAATGGATVSLPEPTVSDNCPGVTYDCTVMSGDFLPCGVTLATCTAIDASGNQQICSFTITVTCPPDSCCLDFDGVTLVDPLNLTGGYAINGFDFVDADNDGDQDILGGNIPGEVFIFRNGPPYDPPNFQVQGLIPFGFNITSPFGLDYNQDGFEDVFAISLGTNELVYYENQGIPDVFSYNAFPTGLILPPQAIDIAVGDLGNDGIADLLVHTSDGGIVGVYYEGSCQAPDIPCFTLAGNDYDNPFINLPNAPVTSRNRFELFDGDCDGDLDLFMANGGPGLNSEVWYFENYGGLAPSGSLPDVETVNYLTDPFGLSGWTSGAEATLLRLADTDNDQLVEAFIDAGSMFYFDNRCLLPPASCPGIELTATPVDTPPDGCCQSLSYSNTGDEAVYGIRLTPLDGISLDASITDPAFTLPSTLNGALITPDGFGPMPASASGLVDLCLSQVYASPQYVAVQYLDENYEPLCYDTLTFDCPVEESCLYIVSDSLQCDTNGYKYVATVTNPPGADFPVSYIKLNITSGPSGLPVLPSPGIVLPDTLQQGDTTMVMWNFPIDANLAGDTLCFILSAHDGPEERLCCAEIDTCLAFPDCDPCLYKEAAVAIAPLPGTGGGDCPGGDPLQFTWLQEIIAGCAERPCGMLVYCCQFQGQPAVNVQDDDTACTDGGGTVYDYQGNELFSYGGIAGLNLDLFEQLQNCTLLFECSQLGDCCYSLLLDNTHPAPGFFTSVQTNILTPGITFSAVSFGLGSGWSYSPPLTGQDTYSWSHNSGGVPPLADYPLFDFCLEGVSSTDSIAIEIEWQRQDSTLCRDTLRVYCPECVVISQEEISCGESGAYTYTFSGQNWSPYPVNAVGFVETSPDFDIVEETVGLPGLVPVDGGAFGPLSVTLSPTGAVAGDTLCFDIVLRQVIADSINILCCYATHCIVLPDCNNSAPCPEISCIPPPEVTVECNTLSPFDPADTEALQALFGTPTAGGDCPGATWQELPPEDNLTDCSGGTIIRSFQAFDGAGNPSTNPCTQTVNLQAAPTDYAIRFPADTSTDCAGLEAIEPEIVGGACELIAYSFSEEIRPPLPDACVLLVRRWRVINFCEYDGTVPPIVVGRDEDCDGLEGEEDIWVMVRPDGLSYLDRDGDENNASPAAGTRSTACDGLSNPAGYWVDSGSKPALSSVGFWEYTQHISLVEDCAPPEGLNCNSSLSGEIQPLATPTDVDGDGDLDDAALALTPEDLLIGAAVDDCSPPVSYSINLEGQAAVQGQSSVSLSCDQLGEVSLVIHAWDAAGNKDSCLVAVTVEDPQGLCSGVGPGAELRLQPNPAGDQLLVRSARAGTCRMEILGMDGPLKRSRETQFRGAAIPLSLEGLPPGVYLLRLRYADGQTLARRFVKM